MLGSADISTLSELVMRMKFSTEGLRMVGRILNLPTEAHAQAAQSKQRSAHFASTMHRLAAHTRRGSTGRGSADGVVAENGAVAAAAATSVGWSKRDTQQVCISFSRPFFMGHKVS